ncbi:MAG TPA: lytic transglycosylase domain-containing protein [Blastocatellia bacterium]|nr:lytic transglycosylase domain-containing protein [Blastocatellia bacterium]
MKPIIIPAFIALSALCVGDARAQETGMQMNVESVTSARPQLQRTPAMVVHEVEKPVADSKSGATDERPPARNGAAAKNATDKKGAENAPAALAPIVLPAAQPTAQPGAQSMETTGNPKYDELVRQSAARNGIDPNLIVAVMRQESGFNPRARSYKGASGLMQLMPATARRFGVMNIYDPVENIEGGAKYLRFLLDTFNGDVRLVLAGYNAGEGAVINSGYRIPRYRETQNYVQSISARYDGIKNKTARVAKAIASAGPTAPDAVTFSGGSSTRLSNNY